MIKDNIKSMIKEDLEKCKSNIEQIHGSCDLYLQLCAKYSKIDKTFTDGIQTTGKIATQYGFDYRKELKQIAQILEVYLQLDEIPIQYTGNVANGVNIEINAKKITNKGNVGTDNIQRTDKNTSIEANMNFEKKEKQSFWKRIFLRRK